MRSTGIILAAGITAAANEAVFAPVVNGNKAVNIASTFNWRLIPATVILALVMGGLETVAPDFAVGLSGLAFAMVLVTPLGNAGAPITNLAKAVG